MSRGHAYDEARDREIVKMEKGLNLGLAAVLTGRENCFMSAEFLDTNVLVYAYDKSAGHKHLKALKIVTELWRRGDGVIGSQVLQEFYVTA